MKLFDKFNAGLKKMNRAMEGFNESLKKTSLIMKESNYFETPFDIEESVLELIFSSAQSCANIKKRRLEDEEIYRKVREYRGESPDDGDDGYSTLLEIVRGLPDIPSFIPYPDHDINEELKKKYDERMRRRNKIYERARFDLKSYA